ncbi:hypothetical protein ACFX11_032372 [Malus domestica]
MPPLLYFQSTFSGKKQFLLSASFRSPTDNLEPQRLVFLEDIDAVGVVYYHEKPRPRLNDETTGEEHDHAIVCYWSVSCCGESKEEEGAKNVGLVSDLQ